MSNPEDKNIIDNKPGPSGILSQKECVATKDLSCDHCFLKCDTTEDLKNHVEAHIKEKPFSCEECNIRFKHQNSLQLHIGSGHKRSKKIHRCPRCRKGFTTIEGMTLHHKSHETPKYPCVHCDKSYVLIASLKHHVRSVHKNEKRCPCHACKETFQNQSDLIQHVTEKHVELVRNKCVECGSAFAAMDMKAHLKTHAAERPFACGQCHKCFHTMKKLEVHVKVHLRDRLFACGQCGRCFRTKQLLDQHLRTHSDERPFKCTNCPAAFKKKCTLSQHLRTHSEEKPYKCNSCLKPFRLYSSLYTHKKIHTRGETKQNPILVS